MFYTGNFTSSLNLVKFNTTNSTKLDYNTIQVTINPTILNYIKDNIGKRK